MSETLTSTDAPADQPELNADEQESLAIAEANEGEQQQLLAGKFDNAQSLEQAYLELQKKLGESREEEPDDDDEPGEESDEEYDDSDEDDSAEPEGQLLTGRGSAESNAVFRSQSELVQAMNDPRYDNDPAYRSDVMTKLENSDLGF